MMTKNEYKGNAGTYYIKRKGGTQKVLLGWTKDAIACWAKHKELLEDRRHPFLELQDDWHEDGGAEHFEFVCMKRCTEKEAEEFMLERTFAYLLEKGTKFYNQLTIKTFDEW